MIDSHTATIEIEAKRTTPIRMTWHQPAMGRRLYELQHDGLSLATYRCKGIVSTGAVIESRHGRWFAEARGLIRTQISVTDEASGREIASFDQPSVLRMDGEVLLGDSRAFRIVTGRKRSIWEVLDAHGARLMRFRRTRFYHQSRLDMEVLDGGLNLRDVVMLASIALTHMRASAQRSGAMSLIFPFGP